GADVGGCDLQRIGGCADQLVLGERRPSDARRDGHALLRHRYARDPVLRDGGCSGEPDCGWHRGRSVTRTRRHDDTTTRRHDGSGFLVLGSRYRAFGLGVGNPELFYGPPSRSSPLAGSEPRTQNPEPPEPNPEPRTREPENHRTQETVRLDGRPRNQLQHLILMSR